MKPTITIIISAATLTLVACKNPADDTTDATVSEAVAETSNVTGKKYTFTDSSTIGFVGSKVTGSHEGGFKKFSGHFTVDAGEPTGGEFTIDMDSTWSDNEQLTGHLKAPDFFNVETFPATTFIVTGFKKNSDSSYDLSGNLTLHGVTKNITFPATVATSDDAIGITAEFDINRKSFNIVYPGKPDDLIRDEVIIKFSLMAEPTA
ncbi:MAG: YceI family protein [Verrucomicrobiota bacterium]